MSVDSKHGCTMRKKDGETDWIEVLLLIVITVSVIVAFQNPSIATVEFLGDTMDALPRAGAMGPIGNIWGLLVALGSTALVIGRKVR